MTGLAKVFAGQPAYAQFCAWLEAAALTTSDLPEGAARYFALSDANGHPAAFAGLAGPPPDLLLRSVVVHPAARRTGFGARLVRGLETEARAAGASPLWLLTESAAAFFVRLGFATADRDMAPPSVAASTQFQKLCPASATLMRKPLGGMPA